MASAHGKPDRYVGHAWAALLVSCFIALLCACDLPRDPRGTLERVSGGVLRAGISANPPWTLLPPEGPPAGAEVQLLQTFARRLDARIEWVVDSESELLAALESGTLDVVAAGLTTDSAWRTRVALTQPFAHSVAIVALPPGVPFSGRLNGVHVAVRAGDPIAARVRAAGAVPLIVDDLRHARVPVAVSAAQAAAWGFRSTPHVLASRAHVLAVPPGENAFLMRLERFIAEYRPSAEAALSWPAAQ